MIMIFGSLSNKVSASICNRRMKIEDSKFVDYVGKLKMKGVVIQFAKVGARSITRRVFILS
jgi:hypothetical protein